MRSLAAVALVAVLAGCGPAGPPSPPGASAAPRPGPEGVVVRVKDGDSLVVLVDGSEEEVRLIGINAPELDECWGTEARTDLARTEGRTVILGAGAEPRDQYGRLLAWVWDDGVLVNADLASNGSALASAYDITDAARAARLEEAEDSAKEMERGMWAPDACGETAPGGLAITGIDADPPGPDADRLLDESVTIVNRGPDRVSLGGMVLRDASTVNRYSFPSDAAIDPGREIRVLTGCGTDTATTFHWCAGGPVWNNAGDDALLTTAKGTIVAHLDYGT